MFTKRQTRLSLALCCLSVGACNNSSRPIASAPATSSARPTASAASTPAPTATKTGLAIGETAPEIFGADIDNVEFKLSDYRGKVVVIDFWGNW